jgi:hypothetical protein
MGSWVSKQPEFWMVFNHGLKRNRITGNTGDGNLMTKYNINNEDLDANNLADVFISKIMDDSKTTDKNFALNELLDRLSRIKNRDIDKDVLPEIKKAIFIIKENYIKYEDKIKIKLTTTANSAATTTANAKGNANRTGIAAANATGIAASNANAAKAATNTTGIVNSNPSAITSEPNPQEASVKANNNKLSNSDEKRYSEILKNLKDKLLMNVKINIKSISIKKKKSLWSVGSDPITRIIILILIIQKLRKKLDNKNNNSTKLDKILIQFTTDYLVKQENKNKNNKITNVLKELKDEIREKNDDDCKIQYDKDLNSLFRSYEYLMGDNVNFSMFQLSSPDESNNISGGSRKKSKKSRS